MTINSAMVIKTVVFTSITFVIRSLIMFIIANYTYNSVLCKNSPSLFLIRLNLYWNLVFTWFLSFFTDPCFTIWTKFINISLHLIFLVFLAVMFIKCSWPTLLKTRIYNLSSAPRITHFMTTVAKKTENFQVNLCFETSNHSMQISDDNSNFFVIHFQFGILIQQLSVTKSCIT